MTNQEISTKHTSILAVFANPKGSNSLGLGAEDRVIKECLKLGEFRDNISLHVLHAATVHDVRRALLAKGYRIIHFSGHGTGQEFLLENALGEPQLVPQDALAELLSAYSPPIECAILNACYTDIQGALGGVPYTIGMSGAISDTAATEFTRGFYDAIGAGKDIEFAFQEGCRTVKLTGASSGFEPVLITETKTQEQVQVKIVSQHQVDFEDEAEEGFLDYILDGMESFETVTTIANNIANRTNKLGEAFQEDTAELQSLSSLSEKPNVREARRIINRTAQSMETFAQQLDEEVSPFRDAFSKAVDHYGKAATLLTTDFDDEGTEQIKEALAVLRTLNESVSMARDAQVEFRQSIAAFPRMTTKLNRAKRHCLKALENFERELTAQLELSLEVSALMENLLSGSAQASK